MGRYGTNDIKVSDEKKEERVWLVRASLLLSTATASHLPLTTLMSASISMLTSFTTTIRYWRPTGVSLSSFRLLIRTRSCRSSSGRLYCSVLSRPSIRSSPRYVATPNTFKLVSFQMVQRAMHFTPKVLLSAPRRSAGVPNPAGTHVLYTVSTYSFETHSKTNELRVLEAKSGESHQLAKDDNISDLNWLDDDNFVCLQSEKDGTTSVFVASVSQVGRPRRSHRARETDKRIRSLRSRNWANRTISLGRSMAQLATSK